MIKNYNKILNLLLGDIHDIHNTAETISKSDIKCRFCIFAFDTNECAFPEGKDQYFCEKNIFKFLNNDEYCERE